MENAMPYLQRGYPKFSVVYINSNHNLQYHFYHMKKNYINKKNNPEYIWHK